MPFCISHDGVKIYYEITGIGKKELFFIMGLGVDKRGWLFQVPYFSEKYKVFLVDNRGVGKSDVPDGFFSTEDIAKDILCIMDKEGVEKAYFVGASMGGMILQKLSAIAPQRVEKQVLACTLAKLDEHEKELMKKGLKFVKDIDIDKIDENNIKEYIKLVIESDAERIFNFLSKNIFSPQFLEQNKELILDFFRNYLNDGFKIKGFAKQLYAILNHDSTEDLEKIKAKTLVITGDKDKMVPKEKSIFIASRIKNSTLKIVENGSHAFMFEMPDVFNREVDKFLTDA